MNINYANLSMHFSENPSNMVFLYQMYVLSSIYLKPRSWDEPLWKEIHHYNKAECHKLHFQHILLSSW